MGRFRTTITSLGLTAALTIGVFAAAPSTASAAPVTPVAHTALTQERTVLLSYEGEQIRVPAAEVRRLSAEFSAGFAAQPTVVATRQVGLIGTSTVRLLWVNPITVAKCILELASFVFGSAGKLAYISAKIMKIVNKSAKLKAALKKVGGVKAALKGLWDKLKGKKMSAKHRADVDGFWKSFAKQAGSVVGIGNCLSLF